MFITAEEAKLHSRIDNNDENALITALVAAANAYVQQAIGLEAVPEGYTPSPMAKSAALLVFADLYEHREAQSAMPLTPNRTLDSLLAMCRDYTGFVQ